MDSVATIGTSLLFARQDHIHPSDTSRAADAVVVKTTAQALSAAQQQQARQNIFAAPFDAMAYGGLQSNGGFEVSQELGTTGRTTPGYVCDGWVASWQGTMLLSAAQYTATFFPGFPAMLYAPVNGAQATLTGTDLAYLIQSIEGRRIGRLAWGSASAQPITIGFWTSHARPGLYCVAVRNATAARSYVATYTHAAANVNQFNVITIPGDTAGTWNTDNTNGLSLSFAMACGPTFTAPAANGWYGGNYVAAPGQVNAVAATTDNFRISGVSVHPGNEAPNAARSPFIMRPYDQELAMCKRYYEKTSTTVFRAPVSGNLFYWLPYLSKRVAPTASLANITYSNSSAAAVGNMVLNGCEISFTATSPGGYIIADAIFDARL
jgi:uncharacterized protein YgiM (DUF1202 family)